MRFTAVSSTLISPSASSFRCSQRPAAAVASRDKSRCRVRRSVLRGENVIHLQVHEAALAIWCAGRQGPRLVYAPGGDISLSGDGIALLPVTPPGPLAAMRS